jgi:WD40 repeat protein/serine/threonine protein kinase
MKPEPDNEETIFNAARAVHDAHERAAFLDEACDGNAELRRGVERLLAAQAQANAFFDAGPPDSPAQGVPTRLSPVPAADEKPRREKPGDWLGRYKLLQQIGEGGCGVVYMAEQEEPIRRRVALKIIKLGMDTGQVIARFEAERQALAMMDHPNIAKVLDAGATDSGRPFFAMELVRGIKITDYCDENGLSVRERLDLFIKVCQAVQHAHQKGIIHRDLKPSNVLVTVNDGAAVPKVIDFGISKAIEGRLTDHTLFTAFEQFIGTPAYMSPEQAAMTSLDIDTRSDIYSLGILLYELLTGRTPFESKELLAVGLDEIRRMIREREPVRPSTRVGSLLEGERATTAHHRHASAPQLIQLLRTDLDWIVMKCLEKDRTRRYETANGLAQDLFRHLHHEPVVARPPGALYRIQKMVRRNKLLVAAVISIAAILVSGIVTSTWMAVRATSAQRREEEQRHRAFEQAQLAEENRRAAEENERIARRNLYAANLSLAQQAWDDNKIPRLHELLRETQTNVERGFEWFYWQRQTHLEMRILRGHFDRVFSARFSPDSRRLVTASVDKTAKVWDVATGRELFPLVGHISWVISASFSPDGHRILTASTDQTAKLWDAVTGRELRHLTGHGAPLGNAAFSPDSQRVITVSFDQTARLWDVSTGQSLLAFTNHAGGIWDVAFSPDGQGIVTTGRYPDFTAKIWDATHGNLVQTLDVPTGAAYVAFSPDGRRLATTTWDHSVIVWDAVTWQPLLTNRVHQSMIRGVAFSPDSRRIATGSRDLTARVWDAADGQVHLTLKGHIDGLENVDFSPNGLWIATAGNDFTVRIWDATRDPGALILEGHRGPVRGVAFSPDARRLVTVGDDRTVRIWDAALGQSLTIVQGHSAAVRCAAFSPDGNRVVTGGDDRTARVWIAATGQPLFALEGHLARITGAAFSPDAQRIITASADQTARVWEATTGAPLFSIPLQGAPLGTAGFSSDRRYFFTAGADARLWDSVDGGLVRTFPAGASSAADWGTTSMRWMRDQRLWTEAMGFAAISPDNRFLAGGMGPTGEVWDLAAGKVASRLIHDSTIFSIAFSPDSRRLVTSSGGRGTFAPDATAKLWDVVTGRELLTLRGHTQTVYGVACSPDGTRIATAGSDGTARIWQAATPDQVAHWQAEERAAFDRWAATRREQDRLKNTQRAALAADSGAIKEWLILAPILPRAGESGAEAFDREIIPQEAQLKPRAGDTQIIDGRMFSWQQGRFEDGMINIDSWYGETVPTGLAYGACYVIAETDLMNVQLRIGGNHPKVYLNGSEVPIPFQVNFFVEDLNIVTNVRLVRGVNTVIIKFGGSFFGGAVLALRFTDNTGKPVQGIKATLDP